MDSVKAQSPIILSLNNSSPIEGCDVVTFTVDVCNNSANSRTAIARVLDMEYFEIVSWGNFDVGNPSDDYIQKDLGTLDPYECEELQFQAVPMKLLPDPIVRARVQFTLGGSQVNHNTTATLTSQGYQVLDGRISTYSIADAILAQEMLDPLDACVHLSKDVSKLTILGTVNLDVEDFYCIGAINSGDVRMGPGAEFNITNNSVLLMRGDFKPCHETDMWRQIHVESRSTILFNNHTTEYGSITNAARGISLAAGSVAFLQRVNFVDNHVGVYMDGSGEDWDSGPLISQFSDLTFRNNLEGDLWGPIDSDLKGWHGADVSKPFAGVVAANCEIVRLGKLDSEQNKYLNLPNGIFAINSTVTVGPSFFNVINAVESITAPNGYAIYSKANEKRFLIVEGVSTSDPIIINNTDYGIRSIDHASVLIRNVKMSEVQEAIFTSAYSPLTQVKVEDCELFKIAERGILHRGQAQLSFRDNTIEMKDAHDLVTIKGQAIETNPVLKHWHQNLDIRGNTIDLYTGKGGILSWVSKGIIQENTIQLNTSNNAVQHGISWQNPFDASIRCNLIEGTSYSGLPYTDGIYLAGSNHTETACNDSDKVGAGIRLFGMNTGKSIRSNTLRDHQLGLAYGYQNAANQTISGQQHFRGNLWTVLHKNASAVGRYGAIHYGFNPVEVLQSKYLVNDASVQEYMPIWSAVGQWFAAQVGTNQDCNEDLTPLCDMGPGASVPLVPDDLDERIMQDSMPYPEWAYTGGRRLLLRAAVHPELLQDSAMNAFYTSAITGPLGAWHEIDEIVRLAWQVDTSLQAAVDQNLNDLAEQNQWIRNAIDSLAIAANEEDSTFWFLQLDTAYLDYQSLWSSRVVLTDSIEEIAHERLQDAWSMNDTLTANEIWEENEKTVRAIAVELVLERRDTLSSQELEDLEDIADQCPTWGGDAVWHARSILRGVGAYAWDDEVLCDEAEPLVSGLSEFVSDFWVTPNPTSGDLTIWSEFKEGSTITIVDGWGRTVQTTTWTGQGQTISLADAPSGIYVLYLQDENGQRVYSRVQIVR